MRTLRVGLIGASRVAAYAIIEPARHLPNVRVHGVAARDPARGARYAADHDIARVYDSYTALIADPDIDLVYIGTPPAAHIHQALAAIANHKPVLVEKPFALNSAGARQVLAAAQASNVAAFEAMHSPHHALFHRVAALLRDGAIGAVQNVHAGFDAPIDPNDPIRWSDGLGGGALMDLGVYPLAWVRRLLGERFAVEEAAATFRGAVDARFTATLRFGTGVTATVASSMVSGRFAARLTVQGERGRIDVDNPLAPQRGHLLRIDADGVGRSETVEGPSSYQAQLVAVRADLFGEAPFPFPADDYVRSMEAIESVRQAWA